MALLDEYDGFLIDIDGVTWVGGKPVPGAPEAIGRLEAMGKPFAFITNSPRETPEAKAEALRAAGIDVPSVRVLTSGFVAIGRAKDVVGEGGEVLLIGNESFHRQASEAGLTILPTARHEEAGAVLVCGHDRFDYDEMRAAAFAARRGAPLLAVAGDPTMPTLEGLVPGTGAVLASIEVASGARGEVCGKPRPALFEAGLEAIGRPGSVAVVGDRLDSDIAGARNAGLAGILVASDPHVMAGLEGSPVRPDHVVRSLAELAGLPGG